MRSHAVGGAPRGIALLGERPAARAASTAAPRILYASDWSGLYQIYAVGPSGRTSTGQLTSGPALMDAGLVYADGTRPRLVRFEQLPL